MIRALLTLLLLVAAPQLAGQPAETEPPENGAEASAEQETELDTNAREPTPAPAVTEPPGDYRASEQISEDLSVSFPVDI